MEDDEFLEVVPPMEQAVAEAEFEVWLKDHRINRKNLGPNDIMIDLIRSIEGKTLRRYSIRKGAIPKDTS